MSTTDALVMRHAGGMPLGDDCDRLHNPGYLELTISIMILVGLLVSYLPQHWRIISRRTSEGISPYFVLLGVTSASASFANIVMLPGSQEDISCCRVLNTFECLAGLLGMAQFAVQFFCFAFILILFLVFFRLDDATVPESELDHDIQPRWQTALMVAWTCLLHGVLVLTVSTVLFIARPEKLGAWANLLGVEASLLAIVQYAPQIWTTYTLKHVGSLSIPMMCIQTPGGFLFAGSLYARLGPAGWSNWGIILVTATSQAVLLCMSIYYELLRRRNSRHHDEATAEDSPLLRRGGIGDPRRYEAAANGEQRM